MKTLNTNTWQKRSMDVGPLLGLGEDDHDLTYSYSSEEEESLNTSLPVNFVHKSPRQAETSLRRQAMKRGAQFLSLDEQSRTPTYLSFEDLLYPDTGMYGSEGRKTQEEEKRKSNDLSRNLAENTKLENIKRNSENFAKLQRYYFNYKIDI